MGTPEFAVPSLTILLEHGYDIKAVITAPDRPAGRGLKMHASPVKQLALQHHLKVLQPISLKDTAFIDELQSLQPDLAVVVAFRMLPEQVWRLPRKGTINLHASLLPKYRGAAPIHWAIIHGETETGVTTFFLKHDLDTGNIIFQEKTPIAFDETAGQLHDRLMYLGATLVLKTVKAIESGHYPSVAQDLSKSYPQAPKLRKVDCRIDWHQPAIRIYHFIRGLSPHPGAWTTIDQKIFKIYFARLTDISYPDMPPASLITTPDKQLLVTTLDYCLAITEVQLEGRKRMNITEFLNGYKISCLQLL